MNTAGAKESGHRAWIAHARQQSDTADRHAGAARAADRAELSSVLSAAVLDGYSIEREIHRGGQGVVYRALQRSTNRAVAIKVLREGPLATPAERARFEREGHILGRIRHPAIVTVHDSGHAAGHYYLVMDYIEGQPLDVHVASSGRRIRATLHLFLRICEAVSAAHLRGVMHRDLKPSNILVDAEGAPHVLDFGLAKLADSVTPGEDHSDATLTGQFIGSLPWSSPEQAAGQDIDIRTDVYSLGVLLYQLLTGAFPYPVTGPVADILQRVRSHPPQRPRALRREIGDEVETILLTCLQKDPMRRYQSAGELARDISHYLAGEPIVAKRDSSWYMLRKGLRRHRLPVGVAAAFMLTLAVFGVSMASARLRAEREADKAQRVLAFVRNMLAGIDVDISGTDELTVHEVLDHAAARAESELADQPAVAAAVHHTLGKQYAALGLYQDAERHYTRSVALRRSLSAGDDPELAETLADLGAALQDKGDIALAEAPARESLAIRRRLFAESSLEVAASLHGLAAILIDEGFVRAVAMAPIDAPQGAGAAYLANARATEAERLLRAALATRRLRLGNEHIDVAATTALLGWSLMGLGRLDEAERALRDSVEQVRRLPGDNERDLAMHLTFLSDLLRSRGELAEEEKAVREAADIRARRLAANHPALAWNLLCLARIQYKLGNHAAAETACRSALDMYIARRPRHNDTADCQQLLARICDAQGRHAEAECWWQACLEIRRALLPPDHPDQAFAEQGLQSSREAQRADEPLSGGAPQVP
ncbi:MAG: serine/threonine protein kinase [Planctomycetia bacterium]|nr:MAG: serine/threonine protein kinase [Planctomycetia bacterium]